MERGGDSYTELEINVIDEQDLLEYKIKKLQIGIEEEDRYEEQGGGRKIGMRCKRIVEGIQMREMSMKGRKSLIVDSYGE